MKKINHVQRMKNDFDRCHSSMIDFIWKRKENEKMFKSKTINNEFYQELEVMHRMLVFWFDHRWYKVRWFYRYDSKDESVVIEDVRERSRMTRYQLSIADIDVINQSIFTFNPHSIGERSANGIRRVINSQRVTANDQISDALLNKPLSSTKMWSTIKNECRKF